MVKELNYMQVAILASVVDRLAVRPCAHYSVDQWLHANGVAINLAARDGRQPIHLACANNHVALASWLYQMGATITGDVDSPSRSRRRVAPSPMALACRQGSFEIVRWLVESGAAVDGSTGGERLLPIHLLCKRGDLRMVKWLYSRGAVLNTRRLRRSYAPVHLADVRGHARVVEWLYSQGVTREQEDPMPQLYAPWRR
jgi:ankyrin repeat protein|mmetsp:Transcript_12737/g.29041  ORF Transcript_12737/g.29041 Transcript_12737/m.29041 type:complete len:199 (+) Transcript_12737:293-889(+)